MNFTAWPKISVDESVKDAKCDNGTFLDVLLNRISQFYGTATINSAYINGLGYGSAGEKDDWIFLVMQFRITWAPLIVMISMPVLGLYYAIALIMKDCCYRNSHESRFQKHLRNVLTGLMGICLIMLLFSCILLVTSSAKVLETRGGSQTTIYKYFEGVGQQIKHVLETNYQEFTTAYLSMADKVIKEFHNAKKTRIRKGFRDESTRIVVEKKEEAQDVGDESKLDEKDFLDEQFNEELKGFVIGKGQGEKIERLLEEKAHQSKKENLHNQLVHEVNVVLPSKKEHKVFISKAEFHYNEQNSVTHFIHKGGKEKVKYHKKNRSKRDNVDILDKVLNDQLQDALDNNMEDLGSPLYFDIEEDHEENTTPNVIIKKLSPSEKKELIIFEKALNDDLQDDLVRDLMQKIHPNANEKNQNELSNLKSDNEPALAGVMSKNLQDRLVIDVNEKLNSPVDMLETNDKSKKDQLKMPKLHSTRFVNKEDDDLMKEEKEQSKIVNVAIQDEEVIDRLQEHLIFDLKRMIESHVDLFTKFKTFEKSKSKQSNFQERKTQDERGDDIKESIRDREINHKLQTELTYNTIRLDTKFDSEIDEDDEDDEDEDEEEEEEDYYNDKQWNDDLREELVQYMKPSEINWSSLHKKFIHSEVKKISKRSVTQANLFNDILESLREIHSNILLVQVQFTMLVDYLRFFNRNISLYLLRHPNGPKMVDELGLSGLERKSLEYDDLDELLKNMQILNDLIARLLKRQQFIRAIPHTVEAQHKEALDKFKSSVNYLFYIQGQKYSNTSNLIAQKMWDTYEDIAKKQVYKIPSLLWWLSYGLGWLIGVITGLLAAGLMVATFGKWSHKSDIGWNKHTGGVILLTALSFIITLYSLLCALALMHFFYGVVIHQEICKEDNVKAAFDERKKNPTSSAESETIFLSMQKENLLTLPQLDNKALFDRIAQSLATQLATTRTKIPWANHSAETLSLMASSVASRFKTLRHCTALHKKLHVEYLKKLAHRSKAYVHRTRVSHQHYPWSKDFAMCTVNFFEEQVLKQHINRRLLPRLIRIERLCERVKKFVPLGFGRTVRRHLMNDDRVLLRMSREFGACSDDLVVQLKREYEIHMNAYDGYVAEALQRKIGKWAFMNRDFVTLAQLHCECLSQPVNGCWLSALMILYFLLPVTLAAMALSYLYKKNCVVNLEPPYKMFKRRPRKRPGSQLKYAHTARKKIFKKETIK